jgi:hypothetical protein
MAELVPSRPVQVEPGFMIHTAMAWRPYENLIDGELDNRTPGKVTGWMRFYRNDEEPLRVIFDLAGDFHDDIRGKVIRLNNTNPSDRAETLERPGTYMDGFASVQTGDVGDMTAGQPLGPWTQEIADRLMAQNERAWEGANLPSADRDAFRRECAESYREHIEAGDPFYPYVQYPYIEWYSQANGRVVLELDPSKVTIARGPQRREKTPSELFDEAWKRNPEMINRFGGVERPSSDLTQDEGQCDATGGA